MRVETATEPGDPERPNEDFVAVALPASGQGGVLVLLDGVTPHPEGTGCVHGVPWFVARLGGALLELSGSQRDMTLRDCLGEAIARTARQHAEGCELSHPHTPQATVVAVRWNRDVVEHLVLSDSVLLIEDTTGVVQAVVDDRLDRLPEPVPALRAAVRALPRGSAERAGARARYVRAVEALRNAEGGFFTAAADPSVRARAVCGSTPRARVRAVAALTDGASRLVEVFHDHDWSGAFALLRKEGPRSLITRVRAAESADPRGEAFPRGKRHDDATAILAEL
ncbi:protein phosphatase 2C domain-containing protein [Streptantibioticus rubrisoli]|uniref:Protein phosphatase 2C domain-containing protein n=1 Tax=Streptantibioticus rubrisoli TaxID=1387313 RepID=A0ABT1PBR4_9ACTN|nr:protein phosphatase 2C domain-containing protein [Streptantibioticus rubrisoli]MCQ4042821.1 protein phosphatase 2C domain-containing protein [Streptantibioticus rubrisoli]